MDMIAAIKAGNAARVGELLAQDPSRARARDGDGVSALLLARYHGHAEIVELLRPAAGELDPFEAAALGDAGRLAQLLDSDPDVVNRYAPDGFTPLQLASFFGQLDAVELLLDRGAETNAVAKNAMRVQALHSACASAETGAGPATALEIARRLLANGADANARQERGFTPLHAAAHNGDLELTRLLLEHGADPAAARDDGKSPADVAAERGHDHLAALLQR